MNCNNQILITSGFTQCNEMKGCACSGSKLNGYKYTNTSNGLVTEVYLNGNFYIKDIKGKVLQYGKLSDTDYSQLIDRLGKV